MTIFYEKNSKVDSMNSTQAAYGILSLVSKFANLHQLDMLAATKHFY